MEFREIEFRSPDDPNLDAIAGLLNEEWTGFTRATLYRKYAGNPAAKPGTPHFICAYENDILAAANGYLPAVYWNNRCELLGVQDCDSYVGRAFRGRGVFTELVKQAENRYRGYGYDFIFGFPNGKSIKTYQNLGWIAAQTIGYTVCVLKPIQAVSGKGVLKWALLLADPLVQARVSRFFNKYKQLGYTFRQGSSREYFETRPSSELYRLKLNSDYVAWRFSDSEKHYFSVFSEKSDEHASVLTSRVSGKQTVRVLAITGTCLEACSAALSYLAYVSKNETGRIMAWEPFKEDQKEAFRKSGFLPSGVVERVRSNRVPFFYKDLRDNQSLQGSVWDLRYADHDTV